jgi:hypothetical protein
MPLYEYKCPKHGIIEAIRRMDCAAIPCWVCLAPAERVAANRVAITAPEADTRGMFRRYREASAEIDHAATRIEQSTGQPVQTPNYWLAAKQRVQGMKAAGEAPVVKGQ